MKNKRLSARIFALAALGFLLGVQNGRIALWKDGCADPIRVFPYPIAALPTQTQQQLRNGIRIDNTEELNRLLENLLS